jgi:hypothetical protein
MDADVQSFIMSSSHNIFEDVFEISNALIAVYVVTEISTTKLSLLQGLLSKKYLLSIWICFNVGVGLLARGWIVFAIHLLMQGPLSVRMGLLCTSIVGVVILGYFQLFRHVPSATMLAMISACALALAYALIFLPLHPLFLKTAAVALLFVLTLYADVYLRRRVTLAMFRGALASAVMYSLCALPLVAIGISTSLLVLVTAMEKIGLDVNNSYFMNQLVYYCVLYGPFYLIYWKVKTDILSRHILPS